MNDGAQDVLDGFHLAIGQCLDGCELQLSRFSDKEGDLVNEHDVNGQGQLGMHFHDVRRDWVNAGSNVFIGTAHSFAF